jgi:hypothetical protein
MTTAAPKPSATREMHQTGASIASVIEQELMAMESGELRSQQQVESLFKLLESATTDQIARAEKLKLGLLMEGRPLSKMPALCLEVESQKDGSKNIRYYEMLFPQEPYQIRDLNPTSTDSLLFHPEQLSRKLLGEVSDARLVSPSFTTISKFPSKLKSERLLVLLQDDSRITYHNGIPVTWDGRRVDHTAWSTNIDTVYFSDWLQEAGVLNGSVKRSLEIGCGSGGVSQRVLLGCPNLEVHHYTDIDPHAINSTSRNIRPFVGDRQVSWEIGKGVPSGRYDLIVTNPPYIPTPDGDGDKDHYSGTKLIKRLFVDGIPALNPDNPDACICVQISSVTLPDFRRYQQEHPEVEVTQISRPVQVPLRILGLLRDERVLKFLIEHCGLSDTPEPNFPHTPAPSLTPQDDDEPKQYYHSIMAFKLKPRHASSCGAQ